MPLLNVTDVTMRFGGITALEDASFAVEEGQIVGLIGPNGAGKTTLFNVVSGLYRPQAGSVVLDGRDVLAVPPHRVSTLGIARTFQSLGLFKNLSVLENTMLGAYHLKASNPVAATFRTPRARRAETAVRDEAMATLAELGLEGYADHPADGLPFGTLKRIELARALMSHPRLLMLDEPANGLMHGEVDELSALVRRIRDEWKVTVLLVEHYMAMVMGISDRVVALHLGKVIADDVPAVVQQDPLVTEAYLGTPA